MASVVAFGETMLDVHPHRSDSAQSVYLGGACGNLVSNVALLGGESALISKFVDDGIGRWMLARLRDCGVNVSGVLLTEKGQNSINSIFPSNEDDMYEFVTYSRETVETSIQEKEVPYHVLDGYDMFHFGSYSICSSSQDAVDACISYAKGKGKKISYDVNYRPGFWINDQQAQKCIYKYVEQADYIKMNLQEAQFFLNNSGSAKACITDIKKLNLPKVLFLTDAGRGSYLVYKDWAAYVPGTKVSTIDTLGAGDAFYAVILRYIDAHLFQKDKVISIMKKANDIAAKSTMYYGTVMALKKVITIPSAL